MSQGYVTCNVYVVFKWDGVVGIIEFSWDLFVNERRNNTPAVHWFCWGGEIGGCWDWDNAVGRRGESRRMMVMRGVMVTQYFVRIL